MSPLAIATGLLTALLSSAAAAQPSRSFDPVPGGVASAYRFDLTRNFFSSPDAAAEDRADLVRRARSLASGASGAMTASALHALLATSDTLAARAARQYAYLSLRGAMDTRDTAAQRALNELAGAVEPAQAGIARTLASIDSTRFAAWQRAEPRLARYEYAFRRARSDAARQLDPAAERAVVAAENEAATWGPALFRRTLATMPVGTVRTPEGDLDLRRQGNQIRNHTDRAVREAGFRQNQAGIASRRDTFALILTRTAALRNSTARQRRWRDYPEQSYAAGGLTTPQVRAILERLAAAAELNKRYERWTIARLRRELGVDTVHPWDLTAPPRGRAAPRFTIVEATREIIAAAEPLGPSYVRELRALLDPRNGRLDLVARENRVDRPGFSTGLVGYPSMFFQGRFEGYLDDVVILTHEAGHAVQNMLMDSAGVLPRYAFGPSYFTESFATLSELLLLEHLARTSRDSADRDYYRRRLMENGLELFRNAYESLLELHLYDSVSAGRTPGAEEIERLTQRIGSRFSVWFGPGSERTYAWVQPLQFYTWPLYRVNYALARLLALRYFDLLQQDPAAFQPRYDALLRNGYDAPPDALLQRFLNVTLSDADAIVNGAVRVLNRWVTEIVGPQPRAPADASPAETLRRQ